MELEERVRETIQDIAQRRNNVTLSEIEWVMEELEELEERYVVRRREARHGILYYVGRESIGGQRFMVNRHNPGSKQVKPYSVDDFVNAMEELGLYEDQTEENE